MKEQRMLMLEEIKDSRDDRKIRSILFGIDPDTGAAWIDEIIEWHYDLASVFVCLYLRHAKLLNDPEYEWGFRVPEDYQGAQKMGNSSVILIDSSVVSRKWFSRELKKIFHSDWSLEAQEKKRVGEHTNPRRIGATNRQKVLDLLLKYPGIMNTEIAHSLDLSLFMLSDGMLSRSEKTGRQNSIIKENQMSDAANRYQKIHEASVMIGCDSGCLSRYSKITAPEVTELIVSQDGVTFDDLQEIEKYLISLSEEDLNTLCIGEADKRKALSDKCLLRFGPDSSTIYEFLDGVYDIWNDKS